MSTHVKNIGGQHTLADGTTVEHGGTFEYEGTLAELQAKYPNKFVAAEGGKAAAPAAPEETDVTEDFPAAKENDLQVVKTAKGWNIYDDGDDPINEKPLKKKDVQAAIDAYLAE